MEFSIPNGMKTGDTLTIPVGEDKVNVSMPVSVCAGDQVRMSKRSDGTWRILKMQDRCSFSLPSSSKPGQLHVFSSPDGLQLSVTHPDAAGPGDVIFFRRVSRKWTFDRMASLPAPERCPSMASSRTVPLEGVFKVLRERNMFAALPQQADGVFNASLPFCGRMGEYALIGDFIAETCLSLPGVNEVHLLGTEVSEDNLDMWAVAEKWFSQMQPRIKLEMLVRDLAEEALPQANFMLGIHPEVTWGGCWYQIIGSMLRSTRNGLCVFATFYECEMKTLLNMIDIYKVEGTSVEVVENPVYVGQIVPEHPPMRYIVLVRSGDCK